MTLADERRLARLEQQMAEATLDASAHPKVKPPTLLDFCANVGVEDKASTTGELVKFIPWPMQRAALKAFQRHSHVYVAKARQVGMTAAALIFGTWSALYVGHREVLIIRTSQGEANDAIRRVALMHESLGETFRAPRIVQANASRLLFENDSRIVALPATEKVARGRASYLLLVDELAFYEWQEVQLNAAAPAASRVIILTTGNGPTDFAYKLWEKSVAGESEYVPVFLPWNADPRRTQEWRDRLIATSITPRLTMREYPAVASECWTAASHLFFELFDPVRHVRDMAPVPEWHTVRAIDWGIRAGACLWLQTHPATGQVFVVGEVVTHDMPTPEMCQAILDHERRLGLTTPPQVSLCDPAGLGRSTQTASTEFDVARQFGLHPVGADNNQHNGCVRILNLLADPEYPLVVASACTGLIRALSTVTPDKGREDIYDDTAPGDTCHLLDCLRYGLRPGRAHSGTYVHHGARAVRPGELGISTGLQRLNF